MRNPTVLLLDLDNTLLGSRTRRLRFQFIFAFVSECRKRGIPALESFRILKGLRRAVESDDRTATNAARAAAWLRARDPARFGDEGALESLVAAVFVRCKKRFFPIPEGMELLRWAQRTNRFRIVLATNPVWPLEIVKLRLGWGGFAVEDFEWITHGGNMHAVKPSLDYYREILDRLDAEPQECLLVGDSARKDLPAHELGIQVFLLDRAHTSRPDEGVHVGNYRGLRALLESVAPETARA